MGALLLALMLVAFVGPSVGIDEIRTLDVSRVVAGEPTQEDCEAIRAATSSLGLFNIVNHGISDEIMDNFDWAMRAFFELPQESKSALKRNTGNAYGYANDELTKQTPDHKELYDYGHDNRGLRGAVDGENQLPTDLPGFHDAVAAYYAACVKVSEQLLRGLALGLKLEANAFDELFGDKHTSYLRLNRYPRLGPDQVRFNDTTRNLDEISSSTGHILGVNRHFDAGALTILRQDLEVSSLQVNLASHPTGSRPHWVDVTPIAGALTVNVGDMVQVLSNDAYRAPEHRVLASTTKVRHSAPFFYNPSFDATIQPLLEEPRYDPFSWRHFRERRFLGDHENLGIPDIQIAHFRKKQQERDGTLLRDDL